MERLTRKKLGSSYSLKNTASAKIGLFTDYDGFYAFFEAVNRLGEIEDILGDDYDLSRLRDLVQADREGRSRMAVTLFVWSLTQSMPMSLLTVGRSLRGRKRCY